MMHAVLAFVNAKGHTAHEHKCQAHTVQIGEGSSFKLGLSVLELSAGCAPCVHWLLGQEDHFRRLHHRYLRGV